MPPHDPSTILLVKDDPGHARLIEHNLRRASVTNGLIRIEDGQKALDYFFPEDGSADPSPDDTPIVVVVDLNLPGVNGYQVLDRLKTDTRTKHISVFILFSTEEPRDIERCYALGCNAYLVKPVDYDQFAGTIGSALLSPLPKFQMEDKTMAFFTRRHRVVDLAFSYSAFQEVTSTATQTPR